MANPDELAAVEKFEIPDFNGDGVVGDEHDVKMAVRGLYNMGFVTAENLPDAATPEALRQYLQGTQTPFASLAAIRAYNRTDINGDGTYDTSEDRALHARFMEDVMSAGSAHAGDLDGNGLREAADFTIAENSALLTKMIADMLVMKGEIPSAAADMNAGVYDGYLERFDTYKLGTEASLGTSPLRVPNVHNTGNAIG